LCPSCSQYENQDKRDSSTRNKELEEIKDFAKTNNISGYDCIIGVSGGKDSTLQAVYVRDVLQMKPLLVSMNYPPEQMSDIGARNISNLIGLGFDCINISCSPVIWKRLMKQAFYEFGNWAKSTEMALFSSVPRIALAYRIPLIWWGENPAVALGDMKVASNSPSDGNRLKYSNTLDGGNINWMYELGLNKNQILQFHYPSSEDFKELNLRIVFLAHFWKEFSPFMNGNVASLKGLTVKKPSLDDADFWGTSMLDEDFFTLNMMIKWLKFGFGKATDNVNEEIRMNRISRKEAIEIVEKYDGRCPSWVIEKFCQYIGIDTQEFWKVVDDFVNPKLFEKVAQGVYQKKFKVGVNLD
jgi:N-acetyl sugar amidotransferase